MYGSPKSPEVWSSAMIESNEGYGGIYHLRNRVAYISRGFSWPNMVENGYQGTKEKKKTDEISLINMGRDREGISYPYTGFAAHPLSSQGRRKTDRRMDISFGP